MVKDGRFGPYVTDGEINASLRKGDTVEEITMERALELIAERRAKGPAKKAARRRPGQEEGREEEGAGEEGHQEEGRQEEGRQEEGHQDDGLHDDGARHRRDARRHVPGATRPRNRSDWLMRSTSAAQRRY